MMWLYKADAKCIVQMCLWLHRLATSAGQKPSCVQLCDAHAHSVKSSSLGNEGQHGLPFKGDPRKLAKQNSNICPAEGLV
mmetsp:Transcript_23575/g.58756  ORF Transcript_23575/g.58756 Transcript_23575/m.58756 type:complete len:80 (-) Transcript_23575:1021-1260(-)